jgi:ferredoxin
MTNDWTRKQLEKGYIGKMKATTIPVNISLSGEQKILSFFEVEKILRNASVISQEPCDCRTKLHNCIEPLDGCLGIDDHAIESIEDWGAAKITVEEALEALKRTYDAGLVHMAYVFEGKDNIERICSCCSCCCHSLSAALRFGYSNHVFSSEYIAEQNDSNCIHCGLCVDRCQFGARKMADDEIEYDSEKCFGCGLCLEICEQNAISLEKRRDS